MAPHWPFSAELVSSVGSNTVLWTFLGSILALTLGLAMNSLLFAHVFDHVIRRWAPLLARRRARLTKQVAALASSPMSAVNRQLRLRWFDSLLFLNTSFGAKVSPQLRVRKQNARIKQEVARLVESSGLRVKRAKKRDYFPDFFLTPPMGKGTLDAADERYLHYVQFQFNFAVAALSLAFPLAMTATDPNGWVGVAWSKLTVLLLAVLALVMLFLEASRKSYVKYLKARNSWMLAALEERSRANSSA